MARLRKAVSYRRLERPYTRISKFNELSYVRGRPVSKVVHYNMGDLKARFEYSLFLKSTADLQIRDSAIESARQTSNRFLEEKLGKTGYRVTIRMYPHHVLRENPLASGAGADRMSTGMARSFGKPIGIAAQIHKGQVMFQVDVNKANLDVAKKALTRAKCKLPCSCLIQVQDNKSKTVA
jgi:large subunit ribosomal protein L10e